MADERGEATGTEINEHASAWLVALDAGTADPKAFEAWRRDPRHAVAFAEVARAWGELDSLRPLRSYEPAVELAVEPMPNRRAWLRGAIAAGIVASIGATAWPWLDEASAETGVGERRTVRLPGGDLVELNTRTRIRWRRTGEKRQLWLDYGEIALTLAGPSPMILTGERDVRLTVGLVNVRRDAAALAITSFGEGVTVDGQRLRSGATAQVTATAQAVGPPRAIDRERANAWQRGEVVFAGETLAFIIADYNRYLVRPLVLGDPALGELRLGGRFTSTDPGPFLRALATGFDLIARDDGRGRVVIERQNRAVQ